MVEKHFSYDYMQYMCRPIQALGQTRLGKADHTLTYVAHATTAA
jgi:hypothetical protein